MYLCLWSKAKDKMLIPSYLIDDSIELFKGHLTILLPRVISLILTECGVVLQKELKSTTCKDKGAKKAIVPERGLWL